MSITKHVGGAGRPMRAYQASVRLTTGQMAGCGNRCESFGALRIGFCPIMLGRRSNGRWAVLAMSASVITEAQHMAARLIWFTDEPKCGAPLTRVVIDAVLAAMEAAKTGPKAHREGTVAFIQPKLKDPQLPYF